MTIAPITFDLEYHVPGCGTTLRSFKTLAAREKFVAHLYAQMRRDSRSTR